MTTSASVAPQKRRNRWLLYLLVGMGLVALIAYIFVTRVAYDAMSLAGQTFTELLPNRPYEEISFPSRGRSYPVYAFWQTTQSDAPVIINIHGYRNSRYSEFIQNRTNILLDLGYNVLTPDLSDNGGKTVEDGRISMGFDETYDVLGAYDYLLSKGFKPSQIGMVAESMGGAISLRVGQIQPEIKVIWADSPFSDAPMALREQAESINFPSFIVDGGLLWAQFLSHDNISEVSPITAGTSFAANHQSVYLVTCVSDSSVNPHHARDLYVEYKAKGVDTQLWEIQCTDHATGILFDHEGYIKRLSEFLKKIPGSPTS